MMGKQSCLVGGGQAGERLRAVDWQNTPLGPVEGWPLSLQAAIRIVLSSDFPMMVHWGPDLITFYNDAYAPSLGNKHPGNLGRPAKEWWLEMWDQLTPIFDHVLSGKAYFVEDARYTPNRNGVQQEAFFTHCHSPLWDDNGHVAGIFLVVTETTGRIVAERKLLQANADLERQVLAAKSSEARLSAFVSASSEGLYSMSGDWQEMHELKGRGFLKDTSSPNPNWLTDYIPVDEQPRVKATLNEAITSRKLFSLEHQVKRVDGSIGWVQSRAIPFLDAAGDITEWFGAVSDITVRRHADEVLQGQKKNLEHQVTERTIELNHLWEISPDLLLVIDYEGIFRKVNPAWTRILGYEPEELLGQNISELVIPDTALSPLEAYERAARGELSEMENRYRHKDGSTRWFSWVAAPSAGQIYATGRDITAAKAAEAELASMQEALRHAQKMKAVGQLTGGVAHDFNNLLAGISGSVDMMQIRIQQGRLNDLERYLGMAQNGLKRAASLTHRLLAFSRRQTLDPKPTRIGQLVLGMQELIQSTVGPATPVRMNTQRSCGLRWSMHLNLKTPYLTCASMLATRCLKAGVSSLKWPTVLLMSTRRDSTIYRRETISRSVLPTAEPGCLPRSLSGRSSHSLQQSQSEKAPAWDCPWSMALSSNRADRSESIHEWAKALRSVSTCLATMAMLSPP